MEQDINRIENLYDRLAREYAEAFSGELHKKPMDREMLRRFAQEVGHRRPVWDLGCGPGQTTGYLKNLGVHISGLDLSDKMLEQARTLHPGVNFIKGNILELEFESGSVEGVVAFYAMVHFSREQVRAAIGEIFRVLRPGGKLLLAYHVGEETIHLDVVLGKEADIDFMFISNDFILGSLKDIGFEGIELLERAPYTGVELESTRAYVFASKEA